MVSLNMIVKNEAENLKRLLPQVKDHVDEMVIVDTGSDDDTKAVAESFGAKVLDFPWNGRFDDARNFALKNTTGDWFFWLDADDDVAGAEQLRALAEEGDADPHFGGYFFKYNYARDEYGNVLAVQWRERLLKREMFSWVGKIHETAMQQGRCLVVQDDSIVVNHRATIEDIKNSQLRNIELLEADLAESGDKPDPRTLYYLGQSYRGQQEWEKAGYYYTKYLEVGGWDEERYDAWCYLADCLRLQGAYNPAIIAGMEAVKLQPSRPEGYFGLAETYCKMAELTDNQEYWEKVVEWTEMGFAKKMPETIRVVDPSRLTWRPLHPLALAYLNLNNAEKAYRLMQRAAELSNGRDFVLESLDFFEQCYLGDKAVQDFLSVAKFVEANEPKRMTDLIQAIPREIASDIRLVRLRNHFMPPRVWENKEIAIYCDRSWEDWADPSVLTGIGGSEEAVIYLSRELVRQGYKVTVYNSCGNLAGTYHGVEYKNYWEFNAKDKFNVVVAWRNPFLFAREITAKHKWVWLHDVPNPDDYRDELVANIDKIIVLSKYHRSLLPRISDEKFILSNNGIVPEQFAKTAEKEANSIIYASSYDRGLECLLRDIMPHVLRQNPDAKLHVAYGWNTFDKMTRGNVEAQQWKAKMEQLLDQPFVVHHGRLGHKKLADLMAKCQVHAYPTQFAEINCITVQKMQCAGAVPVTTHAAALAETNKQGVFVYASDIYTNKAKQKEFAKAIVDQLRKPKAIDRELAIKTFSWEQTAKHWIGAMGTA